jgi:hypothetical protein
MFAGSSVFTRSGFARGIAQTGTDLFGSGSLMLSPMLNRKPICGAAPALPPPTETFEVEQASNPCKGVGNYRLFEHPVSVYGMLYAVHASHRSRLQALRPKLNY